MKMRSLASWAALSSTLLFPSTLPAHHGYAAYDMQTIRSLKGTVTNFMIMNPHSQLSMDVNDDHGNVVHWILELVLYPRGMKDGGWHYDSLKPGDEVTIFYHPVKGEGHA